MPQTLEQLLQPGKVLRIFWNDGNINNHTAHIRGIVDDQVVYCVWSKKKQYWNYYVRPRYWFELLYKDGVLRAGRTNKGETD